MRSRGALQIINLWLSLHSSLGEWPWTYFFLLVVMLIFVLRRYCRSLGSDAIVAAWSADARTRKTLRSILLNAAT